MGNHLSNLHPSTFHRDSTLPTKPTGLYATDSWDPRHVKRLIHNNRLAPRFPGHDQYTPSHPDCCPICFQHYPALNTTKCCDQGVCTECYLQIRVPPKKYYKGNVESDHRVAPPMVVDMIERIRMMGREEGGWGTKQFCPFCKVKKLEVGYRGLKKGAVVEREKKEREKVNELLNERRANGRNSTAGPEERKERGEKEKRGMEEGKGYLHGRKERVGLWASRPWNRNGGNGSVSRRNVRNGRNRNVRNSRRERNGNTRVRRFVVPEPVREIEERRRIYGHRANQDQRQLELYADFRTVEWVRDLQARLEVVAAERRRRSLSSPSLIFERNLRNENMTGNARNRTRRNTRAVSDLREARMTHLRSVEARTAPNARDDMHEKRKKTKRDTISQTKPKKLQEQDAITIDAFRLDGTMRPSLLSR